MLYTPHDKQLKVHKDKSRFKVLNWGRRTGKSTLAVNYTVWMALKKYETMVKEGKQIKGTHRYFIVAPTYRQAKSIFWNDIVKTQIPDQIISKTDETELRLEIPHHNTSEGEPNVHPNAEKLPAISIELKGADNEDSLRGVKLAGVVLDEYAFMKPLVWDKIIRPALSDERGWGVFISTPDGFNHFHALAEHAKEHKDWMYSHATILDNPHISREEIEDIKESEMNKDEGDTWFQEYMADFRQMKGLVYKQFHVKTHVKNPDEVPADGTNLIGLDFGWENPTAAVFVRIDNDNNWWVYDEIYSRHLHSERLMSLLRDKMTGNYFTSIVGDSAAAQQIAELKKLKLPIVASAKGKDSIAGGIKELQGKLRIQPGTGKPKLFVSSACKNIIHEFETYAYEQVTDDSGRLKDIPKKDNDHALDALRYLALTRSEYRTPMKRKKRHYDAVTGRMVS